jgi:sulfoxide reductase heme-binding subunit YedZ
VALVLTFALVAIAVVHGFDEAAMRLAIRLTARTSCLLFVCAFVASALRRIRIPVTAWLLQNRRYLGVSMAVSHGFHAIAIIGLVMVTAGGAYQHDWGAILGYGFIIAMTATSFKPTAAWVGDRAWKILHTVGMYYLWIAFFYPFVNRLSESFVIYLPFVSLLIVALILRLTALIIPPKPRNSHRAWGK